MSTFRKNIYLIKLLCCFSLALIVLALPSCKKKETKLKYGIYRCANGMEITLREDSFEVRNFDFSEEEKYYEEFSLTHFYKKDGTVTLSEEEENNFKEKISKEIDINGQYINKWNAYNAKLYEEGGERTIGLYSKINGETCWFYLEYHPTNDTLTYECFDGTMIILNYIGEEK